MQEIRIANEGAAGGGELNGTYFYLQFYDQVTGAIPAGPQSLGGGVYTCDRSTRTVQTITTSTSDTRSAGGDDTVSSLTYFKLVAPPELGGSSTGWIQANPHQGDCAYAQGDIETELEALDDGNTFYAVTVSAAAIANTQGCTWTVTFSSNIGDVPYLSVEAKWADTDYDGPAYSAAVGDDTVAVCDADYGTCVKGDADLIKRELELLSNVGAVTVSVKPGYDGTRTATDDCAWRVTFDTRGRPELMGIALNDTWNDNAAGLRR